MQSKKTVIVDYGMGNMFSVLRACANAGLDAALTSDPKELASADAVILPGVGAFGPAMENLNKLGLAAPLKAFCASGKPFLGICLGFQLLMTESEEFGQTRGLDIIKGAVKKFPVPNPEHAKVPQIGWNAIKRQGSWAGTALQGLADGEYMYFVHSFYVELAAAEQPASVTSYAGVDYASSVSRGNLFACQFHPEKSAWNGLKMYANFKKIVTGEQL
jgi:glutamine amidotransferase